MMILKQRDFFKLVHEHGGDRELLTSTRLATLKENEYLVNETILQRKEYEIILQAIIKTPS